jgi:hypothetical protein
VAGASEDPGPSDPYPQQGTFRELLSWHLRWGTQPGCSTVTRNRRWPRSVFAQLVHGKTAELETAKRNLRNWANIGRLPDIDDQDRVDQIFFILFGGDPRLRPWKTDLETALKRERESKATSSPTEATQAPLPKPTSSPTLPTPTHDAQFSGLDFSREQAERLRIEERANARRSAMLLSLEAERANNARRFDTGMRFALGAWLTTAQAGLACTSETRVELERGARGIRDICSLDGAALHAFCRTSEGEILVFSQADSLLSISLENQSIRSILNIEDEYIDDEKYFTELFSDIYRSLSIIDYDLSESIFIPKHTSSLVSPDQQMIVSASTSGISVQERLTGKLIYSEEASWAPIRAMNFSPDGNLLSVSYNAHTVIRSVKNNFEISKEIRLGYNNYLHFSKTGEILILEWGDFSSKGDGYAAISVSRSKEIILSRCHALTVSSNDKLYAAIHSDGKIEIFDEDGDITDTIMTNKWWDGSIFSKDNRKLVVFSEPKYNHLCNADHRPRILILDTEYISFYDVNDLVRFICEVKLAGKECFVPEDFLESLYRDVPFNIVEQCLENLNGYLTS